MVFVKVRETYDLHTTKNKMTVIGIHTPKPDIIKRNYPGLLMQCKAYRPVSCDVRLACASVLPLDPLGVGLADGSVSPEDVFNPILYKAMSNKGMSQLESRLQQLAYNPVNSDVDGSSAVVDVDTFTDIANEFNLYYGLLSDTHGWKHANPQAGLSMSKLRPLVYEMVYNIGDVDRAHAPGNYSSEYSTNIDKMAVGVSLDDQEKATLPLQAIVGKAKEFPFLNTTSYSLAGYKSMTGAFPAGFDNIYYNCETDVPYLNVVCGCIIVPPCKLHELFFRMVVEWTIEFSKIRPLTEITNFDGVAIIGDHQRYTNYSYSKVKEAVTGTDETILQNDSCMVSANVDIDKVM